MIPSGGPKSPEVKEQEPKCLQEKIQPNATASIDSMHAQQVRHDQGQHCAGIQFAVDISVPPVCGPLVRGPESWIASVGRWRDGGAASSTPAHHRTNVRPPFLLPGSLSCIVTMHKCSAPDPERPGHRIGAPRTGIREPSRRASPSALHFLSVRGLAWIPSVFFCQSFDPWAGQWGYFNSQGTRGTYQEIIYPATFYMF